MKEIDLDKDYIKVKIQEILNREHSNPQKKNIRVYPERLNFACPICGDSERTPSKKRGNLYFKNMQYICFNEDGCSRPFLKLLDNFDVDIDLDKKMTIYNYVDSNASYRKDDNYVVTKLDKLLTIDELSEHFNNNDDSDLIDFYPIKKNSKVYQYLKYDRFISNFDNLYEAKFKKSSSWIEPVLVILNKSGDRVLGMQIRNLKSGYKRFFKIYNFEKLYNMLNPDNYLDELEAISYNKLSNFYNILNVNWDKPVTVFEGYLDSIFMSGDNAIGAIGIKSTDDMDFLLENDDDLNLQFFYDHDNVGIRKSAQKLKEGYRVFLWQKLVEDLIKDKKDKYSATRYLLKIKDLNELVIKIRNIERFKKINLQQYFSNDEFDTIYLDYTKFIKK